MDSLTTLDDEAANRALAMRMAAVGMPEYQIAFMLAIGIEPLRTLYGSDMQKAAILANLEVAETLWQMAESGKNTAATIFWMKTRGAFEKQTRQQPPASNKAAGSRKEVYPTQPPPPGSLIIMGPNGERRPE